MHQAERPGGRRWLIVAACALILALSMGSIVNGMSAFIVPMQAQFGWDRAATSLINVAGIVGIAFGGLLTGPLADRYGVRPVVLGGTVILGLCYLAAGFTDTLWHLYVLMFLAGFLGGSAIFVPILSFVGSLVPGAAGLAIGIATAGQAVGQGGVPFVSSYLIQLVGVSQTFAITGAAMLVVLVPAALLLVPPPGSPASAGGPGGPVRDDYLPMSTVYPMMCAAVFLCCTTMSVPLMHLVPLVQDQGFTLEEAGGVIFLMLMIAIAGRVAFGRLADVIGALPAYMTATAWMTLLVYGFMLLDGLGAFRLHALLYGFGYAGVMTGLLASIAWLTPPGKRATAMGVINMFAWFGHADGGFLGGYLFDLTGGYAMSYGLAAAAGAVNLVIVGTLLLKTRRPALTAAAT